MLTLSSTLRRELNFTLKTHSQSQKESCTFRPPASVGSCPEQNTGHHRLFPSTRKRGENTQGLAPWC